MVHDSVWFIWTVHSLIESFEVVSHIMAYRRQKTKRELDDLDIYLHSDVFYYSEVKHNHRRSPKS